MARKSIAQKRKEIEEQIQNKKIEMKEIEEQIQKNIGKTAMKEWEIDDDQIAREVIIKLKDQAINLAKSM